jgi:hypothetical protein
MKHIYTVLTIACCFSVSSIKAQENLDAIFAGKDSTAVMDSIMQELDAYLDSLAEPKSFFNLSVGIGTGFFNFKTGNSVNLNTSTRAVVTPAIAYYHKSGLGFSATSFFLQSQGRLNLYQYALSPSFDYVVKKNFSTGIAYSFYKTKDDLNFYTTPIQHEMYAYFNYKKWWLQPGVSLSYGWGSNTRYDESEKSELQALRKLLAQRSGRPVVYSKQEERVEDFAMTLSVKHNFIWTGIIGKRDNITITPVALLTSGTQRFGFNTSYTSGLKNTTTITDLLPGNSYVSDKTDFEPVSTAMVLRVAYSAGPFYLQPQVLFDYYLHNADKRLTTAASVAAGITF